MSRRPQRTLLPGLGVACAVLAGVLVAITYAASLIGVRLPASDPPSGPAAALRVETARQEAVARARERAGAPRLATARSAAAPANGPAGTTSAKTESASVDSPAALALQRETQPEHVATTRPPPPAPPPAGAPAAAAGPSGTSAIASASRRNPLEPLGSGVNATTDGVAKTLRTLTDDLGSGVAPLSPELGGVLTQTGDALGDVVEGTGNLLGQVLGRPRGRR
jgi:hypothetical protein